MAMGIIFCLCVSIDLTGEKVLLNCFNYCLLSCFCFWLQHFLLFFIIFLKCLIGFSSLDCFRHWAVLYCNWRVRVKVTYLGIRSAHERVWLVEWKPIWLSRAYLTRGDLEPARGNLHVCKFLRDLTIIQIRTVTAEWAIFVLSVFTRRTCYIARKEGREGEREKEGRNSYWKREGKGETNNRVLSWINTRISYLLPFTPALDNS